MNLHKKNWCSGLQLRPYDALEAENLSQVDRMKSLSSQYAKWIEEEEKMSKDQLEIRNVGKQDPKRHLEETVNEVLTENISQILQSTLNTAVFQ